MLIIRILSVLRRNWRYRSNLNALHQLDDRMLADIGVSRCAIEAAVRALNPATA